MSGDPAGRSMPRDDAWRANLESWMARHVPGFAGPLHIERLSGGASNLTYRVRMLALLDWEMSTLGDPLTDLGLLLAYWGPVGERVFAAREGQAHRANDGFPSEEELVARYADASGRPVDAIDFYEVLGIFKLAAICEGALARMKAGSFTGHAREDTAALVAFLAEAALDRAGRSRLPALRGRAAAAPQAMRP